MRTASRTRVRINKKLYWICLCLLCLLLLYVGSYLYDTETEITYEIYMEMRAGNDKLTIDMDN